MQNKFTLINNSIFYLLIAYIFTISFEIKPITDTLFCLILLLGCLNIYYKKVEWETIPKWIILSIGFFILSSLFLILFSPDINESFTIVRRTIKSILPAFFISLFITERKKIIILFLTLLISLFLEISYALLLNTNNFYNVLVNSISFRLEGYSLDGYRRTFMLLASKLQFFLIILYILLLDNRIKFNKKLLSAFLFIGLIALFFNNTRMAWAIIAIMFIFLTYCYVKNIKKFLALLCIVAGIFLSITYTQPWIQERIDSTIHMKDGSSQLHYMFVQDSLVMIKEKPIIGWGIGQFSKYYNESFRSEKTNYLIKKYNDPVPVPHPHNNLITILVEKGIIGAIAYIFCYGCFLFFSFKDWYKYKSVSGLIFFSISLSIVLHGFSEYTLDFRAITQYHYCLLGMYLVYRKYEISQIQRKKILP